MKKTKKILLTICISVCVILFAKSLWDEILSSFIPWTRTNFRDYQEYIELLDDQHFYASNRFIKEIPAEAIGTEYYVKRDYKEKYAAHSIVLGDEYEQIVKERVTPYLENCNGDTRRLIYSLQEQGWGIDDLKQAGAEVDFIQNVMQNPNEQQEYYCLVVIRIGTYHGIYTGVILNDTTKELIEFSVEVPEKEEHIEIKTEKTEFSIDESIDIAIAFGHMIKYYFGKLLGY